MPRWMTALLLGVAASAVTLAVVSATSGDAPRVARAGQSTVGSQQPGSVVRLVVGLGDSVPAAAGCSCSSYPALVASELAAIQHVKVASKNLSVPGQTTTGLVTQMDDPAVAAMVAHADVVIVTVGANDVENDASCSPVGPLSCYAPELEGLSQGYATLLAKLRNLLNVRARVVVTDYWNVLLAGATAREQGARYIANSVALTGEVNHAIHVVAASAGARFVDLVGPFNEATRGDDTSLLEADGDHPNAAGQALIARTIMASLLHP